ncbi:unnamed protein product [Bathycoccus prasinos]|jgi:hypothetical protein
MKKTEREEEKRRKRRGFVPFVNVTFKAAKKRREEEEQQQCVKTPKAIKKRRNATMAFGTSSAKKFHHRPKREEKESLSEGADSGAGAGARAGGGGEEEDKEEDSKHPDVAWTAVVTMLRHVDAFVKDSKEDPEIIASAYLWKEGRFFPILREALLASSSNAFYCADTLAGEEKERAAMAVARKVEERWKRVKIKRGEKASDAREILLGVLETLEEEMVEAHRVGKLPKKKKKKVEETAKKEEETTKDADKKELEAPLNFGEIVAQEMAAKEALWKPKEEEEEEEACQNLSVYETRCPARRNFEMRCEVRTQCVACQDVSVREETMMHLSLDMPSLNSANGSLRHHPLEVQLREYFQTKVIEHRCAKCGADVAEETRLLTQLPRYLLVHVNRFVWMKRKDDPSVNERRKVCWRVSCPKNLPLSLLPKSSNHTLPPEVCASTTTTNDIGDGVYSLHSVLSHCGEDEEGGRTLLHVRNKKVLECGNVHHKETWTIYDEDIVGTSGNARLNETEKFERESYVLLYSHPSFTF